MYENAPVYNLKAVIKEPGLTPATLCAWERLYHLFKPLRSPGGHRLFTQDEINLIQWLVARQKEGLSVSHAVNLWRSQANQTQAQGKVHQTSPTAPALNDGMLDRLHQTLRQACLAFHEPEAELATAKALAVATPEVVCAQISQKGLAELGEGWYAGAISVQQAHFASALVARRLNALFAVAPIPTRPGRLLATCPPGEDHGLAGFRENEALIVTRVRQILRSSETEPRYVENANTNFYRAVIAALVLGKINFLDYSAEWLNGLLANYDLTVTLAIHYYKAFHQAVQEQPDLQAGPVLDWLARFEKKS